MKLKFVFHRIAALAVVGMLANMAFAQGTATQDKPAAEAAPTKPIMRVDPSGTWRFEVEVDGQVTKHALALQLGKDGEVTGTYKPPYGDTAETKEGKIDGNQLKVDLVVDYQGESLPVKLSGTVKDDKIDGDILVTTPEGGELSFVWDAKRSVEIEDIVGTWELEIDAVDTILEPILEISLDGKNLKGTYKDPDQGLESVAEEIRIEENNLKFTIKGDFQGAPLIAKFSGRPYGAKVNGYIEYDIGGGQQVGEVSFEGVHKAAKKEEPKTDAVKVEIK